MSQTDWCDGCLAGWLRVAGSKGISIGAKLPLFPTKHQSADMAGYKRTIRVTAEDETAMA